MAKITVRDDGTLRRVVLAGELDDHGCEEVVPAFERAAAGAAGDVVADLEGVTFAGSLAVRMLLRANEVVREHGHRFFVTRARPHLLDMLDRVGALKVIAQMKG
jgi:anti-anti-sigma factor